MSLLSAKFSEFKYFSNPKLHLILVYVSSFPTEHCFLKDYHSSKYFCLSALDNFLINVVRFIVEEHERGTLRSSENF